LNWKQVLGSFQIGIPVSVKELMLENEERLLAILRWILLSVPAGDRWYPVFSRYVGQIAGRVKGLGGDPGQIKPSPTGEIGPVQPGGGGSQPPSEKGLCFTGKIAGLIFDHFGDFEGFVLETDQRELTFLSREKDIEKLAERAWCERLRITVCVDRKQPQRPLSIVVLQPPAHISHRCCCRHD